MDALVLCGGMGTRLDSVVEKPLFRVAGSPMVDAVLDALGRSRVGGVTAVTSPHAPETRAHLQERGIDTFHAEGEGYVADLRAALAAVDPPVVTVAADLPLLASEHVDRTLDAHDGRDRTVCVPAGLKAALDVSADRVRPDPRSAERASGRRPREVGDVSAANVADRESGDHTEPRAGAHGGPDLAPTGLNVVAAEGGPDDEAVDVRWDARLAVNVNRRRDAAVAEVLVGGP